jgi:hypothetical protein
MTESSDPTGTVLTTTPADFTHLVRSLKDEPSTESPLDVSAGEGDVLHVRVRTSPAKVVTTTRGQWDAFVLGVQAGEFDHLTAGHRLRPNSPSSSSHSCTDDPPQSQPVDNSRIVENSATPTSDSRRQDLSAPPSAA